LASGACECLPRVRHCDDAESATKRRKTTLRIALFERSGGDRCVGAVAGDEVIDLTNWVGPLGSCPLAAFLARAADERPPMRGERVPLDEVAWLPPALGSAAPLCVGLNYGDHAENARKAGVGGGAHPALFSRYWTSMVGHRKPIVRPRVSKQLDFEGELVVVIGRHCRRISRQQALEVVAGYTIGQEGSVRDWQRLAATPTAGKNFAMTGAMGPWMVTADEVADPADLRITTRINGETLQDSDTAQMIFDVPTLIEHITTFMPLAPGDVIFTGTPAGTLSDRGGQRWLDPGDVVTVEIPGIGELQNYVVDDDDSNVPSTHYEVICGQSSVPAP
jgi:2-keto-4-pentenoate hydratase/2-oxohepta-3-ene-1,7-dioic acid hydratase in catechol pathway